MRPIIETNVEQAKTACGYVPVTGVEVGFVRLLDGNDGPEAYIFTLAEPDESVAFTPRSPGSALLSLASCVVHDGGSIKVSSKNMLSVAGELGPLFGISLVELISDWAAACVMADLAVSIQQIANGARSLSTLVSLFNFEKLHCENPDGGVEFDFFDVVRDVRATYLDRFGGRRVVDPDNSDAWNTVFVRHAQAEGRQIYVFVILSIEAGEENGQVEIAAMSLDRAMSRSDYEAVRALVSRSDDGDAGDENEVPSSRNGLSPLLGDDVWLDLNGGSGDCPVEGTNAGISSSGLVGEEAEMSERDTPVLAAMVQALIAAHLAKDAHVDPFQTDELTGYITFDTLLSWIWFDFSSCLGAAKIGYCAECGTPFSLVGHRGMERSFCSPACKTKAKNERMKRLREGIRQDFLAGATLKEIAAARIEDEGQKEAVKRVRETLQSWPKLKHLVEESIREEGVRNSLLARCVNEGLTPKVLSKNAREMLRAEAQNGPRNS